MRKLTLCLLGLVLAAGPALAQTGGGGGGEAQSEDSPSSSAIGSHDRPHEMKPIARDQFDKVVTALFAQADLNHDGVVTLGELQSVIGARRDLVIRARFKEIDANHDGTVDINEFIAWQQRMGSAAASACSVYAGHIELVPESLGPALGDSERDEAMGIAVEPLTATLIAKANVHYGPGATLADILAYENARFDAADTNHDGFLVEPEIAALRHAADKHPGGPMGRPG